MPLPSISRRQLLLAASASPLFAAPATPSQPRTGELRRAIVDSPVSVGLHRARVYTEVFRRQADNPWIVRKAMALREYLETVPLYLRPGDRLAGAISETPGAMPVMVELGIAENNIYTGENPARVGYLDGRVPAEIREYWMNRNLWGRYRTEILGESPFRNVAEVPRDAHYKMISCQGHLSPSYSTLLKTGLRGALEEVAARRRQPATAEQTAFLQAAQLSLEGVSRWALRYSEFARASDPALAGVLRRIALDPPETFREAMQLIWLVHQAIHIEGHGYSCTPDHIDQLLFPFYERDRKAGRIDDAEALALCENFTLKQFDNSYWGPEHHLTQGLAVGGAAQDGRDLTNRLSWLFVEGATNMGLPEPLIWTRWHPAIDPAFFDFCLQRIGRSTCFPMLWNDKAVIPGLVAAGVRPEDAQRYLPVGCNELAIPGQFYFNPGANANYLGAVNAAMSAAPASFDGFVQAFGKSLEQSIRSSYAGEMKHLQAQMRWGVTPLTSCFFDGCVADARDMALGTKYNLLSCGGVFFANAVDCLAAIRQVVYEKREATLDQVREACAANYQGHERLRAKLLAAPKHGNDDPRLDSLIDVVERLRDEPMKRICRDPRDGAPMINSHVVRSSAVRVGLVTPATPDGRLAGTPLASSVAASPGCERSGPTAVLNSVAKLNATRSWQGGYQVNIRFQSTMLSDPRNRRKVQAMLTVYFQQGGQELQINSIDSAMLRAAQKDPTQYRDLVVRIAGFSEFFVNLTPDMQNEIIARTEHM